MWIFIKSVWKLPCAPSIITAVSQLTAGLYAVGEVCASHGVTRPGGTALNAGQVGAVRAAEGIRLKKVAQTENTENDFRDADVKETLRKEAFKRIRLSENAKGDIALSALWLKASKRMSAVAGMIRSQRPCSAWQTVRSYHW